MKKKTERSGRTTLFETSLNIVGIGLLVVILAFVGWRAIHLRPAHVLKGADQGVQLAVRSAADMLAWFGDVFAGRATVPTGPLPFVFVMAIAIYLVVRRTRQP